MENEQIIKEYIKDILNEPLKTKIEENVDYHNNTKKDDVVLYWDEFNNEWTIKRFAQQGKVFNRLKSIINDIIIDKKNG